MTMQRCRVGMIWSVIAIAFAMLTVAACGQATGTVDAAGTHVQSAPAKALSFDVVSVKRHPPGDKGERMGLTPDGVQVRNQPLDAIVREAYGLSFGGQIVGAPDWVGSERFDIDAKVSGDDAEAFHKLDLDQVRQMVRPILADRFKLVAHSETRILPVYALVIAKSGLKMKQATPDETSPNGVKGGDAVAKLGRMAMRRIQNQGQPVTNQLTGQAVPTAVLVKTLAQLEQDRFILDKTGLTGNYDFVLIWKPDTSTPPDASSTSDPSLSIFTAIQEQLGLKLEPDKGPVPVLVIDHIERPSGN